jgi:hypothetical protein
VRHPLWFPAARWSASLRITSVLALALGWSTSTVLIAALSGYGVHSSLRYGISLIPALLVSLPALFLVRGYALSPTGLQVERPLWHFSVPLDGITEARLDPTVLRGAKRVFGIAGLFSYSCRCRSRSLGRFTLYGTDPSRSVVLFRPGRSVVVTPRSPDDFLAGLRLLHAGIGVASRSEPRDLSGE